MTQQTARQAARRAAVAKTALVLAERRKRERRVEALTMGVVVALAERDAAVEETERRAADCLAKLVDDEGLTVREVVDCCADALTEREALRLRRRPRQLPAIPGPDDTGPDDTAGPDDAEGVPAVEGSPDDGAADAVAAVAAGAAGLDQDALGHDGAVPAAADVVLLTGRE